MRNNRNSSRNFFITVTRFGILAMAFALVFALVLSGGIFDVSTSSDNVALAADKSTLYNAAGGLVVPDVDQNAAVTATSLNFPGTSSGTTTWSTAYNASAPLTFFATVFDSSTLSVATENGKLTNVSYAQKSVSENGGSKITITVDANETITLVFNYQLPAFLANLISSNDNYRVDLDYNISLNRDSYIALGQDWRRLGYRVVATPSAINANEDSYTYANLGNDISSKTSNFKFINAGSASIDWHDYTGSVSLKYGSTNVAVVITVGTSSGSLTFQMSNFKITGMRLVYTGGTDSDSSVRSDGAAPQIDTDKAITMSPYRATVDDYEWPETSTSDTIDRYLGMNLDTPVADFANSISVNMYSYTNEKKTENGIDYYKKLEFEWVDYYDYEQSGSGIKGDKYDAKYAAGIKTIQIGDTSGDEALGVDYSNAAYVTLYSLVDNASVTKDIIVEDVKVGTAVIMRINRARVKLQIYFTENPSSGVRVAVGDYGNAQTAINIRVKGIDKTDPEAPDFNDFSDYFKQYLSGTAVFGNWLYDYRTDTLDVDSAYEEDENEGFSPYLWYYDVVYSDTANVDWSTKIKDWYADDGKTMKGLVPFAVGSFDSFIYNFGNGTVSGVEPLSVQDGTTDTHIEPGYYLFVFYVMDLAGNTCESWVAYNVKVDPQNPQYDLQVSVGDNDSYTSIDKSENGTWTNQNIRATLTWDMNLSGNKLLFSYAGKNMVLYFRNDDSTYKIAKILVNNKDCTDWDGSNSYSYLSEGNKLWDVTFECSATDDGVLYGKLTITFTGYNPDEKAYLMEENGLSFELFSDGDNDLEETGLQYTDNTWVYGGFRGVVAVHIDKVAPVSAGLSYVLNNQEYFYELGDVLGLQSTRNWYNSAWDVNATVKILDDEDIKLQQVSANDFNNLYVSVWNFSNLEEFASVEIADLYNTDKYDKDHLLYSKNFFINDVLTGAAIDFINKDAAAYDAGLRVVLLWVEDIAGNINAVPTAYGILVDANEYTINFTISENEELSLGDVAIGFDSLTVKRGEWAKLVNRTPEGVFVPYQVLLNDGTIYTSSEEDSTKGMFCNTSIKDSFYARIAGGVAESATIEICIDDKNNIGELGADGEINVELSVREKLTISVSNTSVEYTGESTKVPFVVTDYNGNDMTRLVGRSIQFTYKTMDEAELGEAPVQVGTYIVVITLNYQDKSYVADSFTIDKYSIIPGNIIITVSGSGYYGDAVAPDIDIEKPYSVEFTQVATFSIGVQNPSVGKYPFTKTGDYYFDDIANYTVTYVLGDYTVLPRPIVATFDAATKEYGDPDPRFTFSVAGLGSVQLDANVFANATIENGKVTIDAKYVTREHNINKFGFDEVTKTAAYKITGIDTTGIGLNSNFVLTISNNASNTLAVTKRNITVRALKGQVFESNTNQHVLFEIVDDEDKPFMNELEGLFLGISTKNDDGSYGVAAGDLVGLAHFIVAIDDSVTVTVLEAGANYVVLQFKYDSLLTVSFGEVFDITALTKLSNYDRSGSVLEGSSMTLKAEIGDNYNLSADKFGNAAGSYRINMSVASYIASDGSDVTKNYTYIFKGCEYLTVKPAAVTVTPVLENNAKTYGDVDNWVFGYTYVGDVIDEGYVVANDAAQGKIVRALYRADGTFVQLGTQFDRVTTNGTVSAQGHYYGAYIAENFYSSDPNIVLTVDTAALNQLRFVINPKEIDVGQAVLTGKDKTGDGTSFVIYKADAEKKTAINLASLIARIDDDVWVDFVANYVDGNGAQHSESGEYYINFHDLSLKGDDAINYVIVGTSVTTRITYKITGDGTVNIVISSNDFTISKVYDGTTALSIDDIAIGISSALCGLDVRLSSGIFSSKNAGNNIQLGNVVIYVVGISEGITSEDSDSIGIEVKGSDTYITIKNAYGTITPREISLAEVVLTVPATKYYDGTTSVNVGIELAGTVLQTGDDFASLGLAFPADVGEKDVQGSKLNPLAQDVTFDTPSIASSNYTLGFDADAINAAYKTQTTILPAVLSLDITYDEQKLIYNADTKVENVTVNGIKVEQGAIPSGETIKLKDSSTAPIGFTYTDAEGNAYQYVQLDENGNVRLHDVKASNLSIITENINPLNYNLDLAASGTTSFDDVVFEALIPLNPKTITLNTKLIKVEEKIYDGSTSVELSPIDLAEYGVYDADKDYVEFRIDLVINDTPNASDKLYDVKGSNARLEGTDECLASYTLAGFSSSTLTILKAAKVNAAPLAVSFDMSKTYDGTSYENITTKCTLTGFVNSAESTSYQVNILAAAFSGVDVTSESGNVYGITLQNTSANNVMNYRLVYATLDEKDGFITEIGALPAQDDNGNQLYYYELTDIVYAAIYDELNDTDKAAVVAKYQQETVTYGILDAAPTTSGITVVELKVADAKGVISPAVISYTVEVDKNKTSAFQKTFDDSTETIKYSESTPNGWQYNGRNDENNTFEFNLNGEYGFVIEEVSVVYTSANVGSNVGVTFKIESFSNEGGAFDSNNYTLSSEGITLSIGKITPADINVAFADAEADGVHFTYGDAHTYSYDYSVNGKTITVSKDADGNLYGYILEEEYAAAGFKGDTEGRIYAKNEDDGTFTLNANGTYVRLNGTFQAAPLPNNEQSIVNAGTYAVTGLTSVASNFTAVIEGCVVVDKAPLTVSVTNTLTKDFGSSIYPTIDFAITGEDTLKNNDAQRTVFEELNKKAAYYVKTGDDLGEEVDVYSKISKDLDANQSYVLVVTLANYDVKLDKDYILTIVLPELTGISTTGGIPSKTYDGNEVTVDDIKALITCTDTTVTYADKVTWSGAGSKALNAGSYIWTIVVSKTLGNDEVTYTIEKEVSGEYIINPKHVTISSSEDYLFTYNKGTHELDPDKLVIEGVIDNEKGEFAEALYITYMMDKTPCDAMLNAGLYSVVFNFAGDNNFATNYTIDNKINALRVLKATIEVEVNPESKQFTVSKPVTEAVGIEFTVKTAGFNKSDFTVTYNSDATGKISEITEAGNYVYTISYVDTVNYSVINGSGNVTVYMDEVSFVDGDTTYATVRFNTPVTVSYRLSYELATADEGSAAGKAYWQLVNDYVTEKFGDSRNEAVTEGVLTVTLLNGKTEVHQLNQQMTVTVNMPTSMTSMDGYKAYYVDSNGELVEITDYTVNAGEFSYNTDYISNIVFVRTTPIALPIWIWILVAILALLVILAIILAIFLSKKSKDKNFVPVEEAAAPAATESAAIDEAAADIEIVEYYDPNRPSVVGKNKKPPIIGIR